MGSEFENETTNDMKYKEARSSKLHLLAHAPTGFVSMDGCESYGVENRVRDGLQEIQCGRHFHRRHDKAMRTVLVIGAVAFAICLSANQPPSLFVDSFSFKLFHRSGGGRHKSLTDSSAQILSASSAQEDIESMNNSFENSIENAKYKNNDSKNDVLPSLVDWEVDSDGQRITGRSVNHPFVPDGELITTSCLDPSCTDGGIKAGDVVSTIQGTKYELLKPPPVGSSYVSKTTTSSSDTSQVFKEDIFSFTTTGLPYDQQLAFLEELTAMVKTRQAAEMGTTASVPKSSPSTSVNNPSGPSTITPPAATSARSTLPLTPPLEQRGAEKTKAQVASFIDQPELNTQQNVQASETPPRRPTFSINKSLENQEREESKQKSAPSSKEIDNSGNLLGGVATVAAAAAASAAVTLGGPTGLANDLLDEARRQVDSQISPQTREVLASVNTQVEETSRVVLPYLEEQIRIAEAKVEEAHLDEKAKSAWNGVADYLNEQSRPSSLKKGPTTSTASLDSTKSIDPVAVEEEISTAPAVDDKVTSPENSLKETKLQTTEVAVGAEQAKGSTSIAAQKQVSNEIPTGVATESSGSDFVKEPATTTNQIEEVLSSAASEGVATAAPIEEALTGAAVVSSNSPQPFLREQTLQESEQVDAAGETNPETLRGQASAKTSTETEPTQEQLVERTGIEGQDDVSLAQTEEESEIVEVGTGKKVETVIEAAQMQEIEKTEEDALQVEDAEQVEAEAEVLRARAIAEEQELTEAARIVEQQLEAARREVGQAVVGSSETPSGVQVPPTTEIKSAKVEVLKASESVAKSSPSIVENFGGNFVVNQEEQKLESAAISPPAASVDTSESNVQKPTPEMVENAITVEVEPAVDTSLTGEEDIIKSNVEETAGELTTELSESLVAGRTILESEIEMSKTVESSPNIVGKVTEVFETGKRTIQDIKTTGQEAIDNGKRTYQSAVDTGRKVVDTGKRTAKAIEETGQMVGAKGKEVYETGQKYARIVNENIPIIIENGEKAVAVGKEILEDEQKVKAIAAGSAVAGIAVAFATGSFATEEGTEGASVNKVGDSIQNFRTNDRNETFAKVQNNGESSNAEMAFDPPSSNRQALRGPDSTPPSEQDQGKAEKAAKPLGEAPQPKIDLTSPKMPSQEAIEPEMLSSIPSPKVAVSSRIGVQSDGIIDTTSTNKPSSKSSTFPKKASPFKAPPKREGAAKQVGFGAPPSKGSTFLKKASPFASPPKGEGAAKQVGFGGPQSKGSTFPKKASPFTSPPKGDKAVNKVGFGAPPSKGSTFPKKASPFTSPPKGEGAAKQVGFGVPSSKRVETNKETVSEPFPKLPVPDKQMGSEILASKDDGSDKQSSQQDNESDEKSKPSFGAFPKSNGPGKKTAPSFGSIPKDTASDKKTTFGVPSAKSSGSIKKPASPFGSPPKQPVKFPASPFGSKSPVQAGPGGTKKFGISSPPGKFSAKESNLDSDSAESEKKLPILGKEDESDLDKKSAPSFGSIAKDAASDKKNTFGVPSAKSSDSNKKPASPFGSPPKQPVKFPASPFGSKSPITKKFGISSPSGKFPAKKSQDKQKLPITGKKENDKSPPPSDKNNQSASPKFGIPTKSFPSKKSEKAEKSPEISGAKFPTPPKAKGTVSNFDGSATRDLPDEKDSNQRDDDVSFEKSTSTKARPMPSSFGKAETKSPFPSKAVPTSESARSTPSFGKAPPFPTKAVPTSESAKTIPSFGKGKTKSPFPPSESAKTIPSFGKAPPFPTKVVRTSESAKTIPSFGKGKTKSPFPPSESAKTIPTFGKGKTKSPFPPSESAKPISSFGKAETKSPFPPKGVPTSKFGGTPNKTGAESAKSDSSFAGGKTKSPFPQTETEGRKADFGSTSNEMLSDKTSTKSPKKTERSFFTDTSRNGYDEPRNASFDSPTSGDDSDDDNLIDRETEQFPTKQSFDEGTLPTDESDPPAEPIEFPRSLVDDDQESTYLTEENQKRFFPQPGSTQQVELGYRVGASIEDKREREESTYLTGTNEGTRSPKPASPSPQNEDSKPRITSIDENVSTDGMYGKSPDELMAEVMRIAREQEERNSR